MIYLWFESERKQYTIIFTTERETKSTKERDGKRRVWEHEHGESGKYVQYCPFMKFGSYNSYHEMFTSIKVHQKTHDNVKREKPSRIWSCTKYPPNSIFIYKWAHTCLLSKYYFSKKVFFCRNSGFIQCHQYIDLHIACSSCVFVRVKRKSLAEVILLIRKRNSHLFLFSVDSIFSRWLVMRAYTEILHIVFLYSFLASLLSFYHYFFPFSIYETFALFFLYNIGKFPKDISSWRQNKTRKV